MINITNAADATCMRAIDAAEQLMREAYDLALTNYKAALALGAPRAVLEQLLYPCQRLAAGILAVTGGEGPLAPVLPVFTLTVHDGGTGTRPPRTYSAPLR